MAGGVSTVYLRQIESGYRRQASASILGSICYALGIAPEYLRGLPGEYNDIADVVADCVAADILLRQKSPGQPPGADEGYIRNFPGLTDAEKDQLAEALHGIRRQEPLGKDLWRRRGA
jgi:transcriptional regulator with XRE-family HTH domain